MALRKSQSAKQLGRETGYGLGLSDGTFLGRCEAVIRKAVNDRGGDGFWDVRVLYVTSGKGYPYAPIDHAIIESLRLIVRELIIGNPDNDPVKIGAPVHNLEGLIKLSRPDLVIVLDGMNLSVERINSLRQMGIPAAIWLTDDPYYTDITIKIAPHYDYIFTLERNCLSLYQELGCNQVHYLPFAAQSSIFRPKPVSISMRKDISFIGSAYWNRIAVFDRLAPYLSGKNVSISGIWWERLQNYKLIASKVSPGTWLNPEETSKVYNGAKIVINLHRAYDDEAYNSNSRRIQAFSPNPRTFEISGCGVLQITDVRDDLGQFYKPGIEVVTYTTPEELREKMEYYLQHEEERRFIALRGLYRTMRDHTYVNRMAQLLRTVFGGGG
ncbi:glycosyltransferase [Paenibacillus alkaliterrae]|uniref:CgeB family protein n=1 Tax=Paenibacillus alkaliterrae TaxID=320909 RepID=UPI001F214587|nr:glycosyltransferase [Paenibacillus alkaliterrae]MCF2940381.1 glycosyltransferase [Paenibacillus alkaliterrae]